MSVFNIEVAGGSSVRLPTAGKYCDRDIVVTADGGSFEEMWVATIQRSNCESIKKLPDGLTIIGRMAFFWCKNLAITSIPASVQSIETQAFSYCSGISELTFEGTPTSIANNAFMGSTDLLTINVPWAEGAVANAPWGAANATINYGYTGG